MTISFKHVLGTLALALAVGAGTSQAAVEANFHLPVKAHWGNAVLAPGDYKIRLQDETFGIKHFLVEGQGRTVYAVPTAVDQRNAMGASIQLVELNGDFFVKQFRSDLAGKAYTFRVPKGATASSEKSVLASK